MWPEITIALALLCCAAALDAAARPAVSLDGPWRISVPGKQGDFAATVPAPWQAKTPELAEYSGEAAYRRDVAVPDSWKGKRVFVCFGAVDYFAEVLVNGKKVGEHEGGYTPFEFEVTDLVRIGAPNELTVNVIDPAPDKLCGGFKFEEIPHGKQSWYGNCSGIWQSARLEARSLGYIERTVIDPDIDASKAHVRVILTDAPAGSLRLGVHSPKGAPEGPSVTIQVPAGAEKIEWTADITDPKLWSPESPALYELRAELIVEGKVWDTAGSMFGMRKIEARDGKILLNNKPIYLIGALDQDFYPITHYTVPSRPYVERQFKQAKQLGLNTLRCHIKVPDPIYLEYADRLGLLVWYEIPNWITLTDDTKRRAKDTLTAMLARDHNHPSLVVVSIINEGWGIDSKNSEHLKWQAQMYDYAKSLEPGRLVVDNSACGGNFHVKTDIDDYHNYFQIPENAAGAKDWIKDYSSRPAWTFTDGPEKQRRGWEPLVVSEFGNWGLPRLTHLAKRNGSKPWWFANSRGTNTRPEGVEERFRDYHLDTVFGSIDGLSDAFQRQEWRALKFQIEEMRKYPSIAGYVITEFTDVQWECNGLLDFCRNRKVFYKLMPVVQSQDVVFARTDKTNYVSGEAVAVDAFVSHFSQADLSGSELTWRVAQTGLRGRIPGESVSTAGTTQVAGIRFAAPRVETPTRFMLAVMLKDAASHHVARNGQEFLVFPSASPELPKDVLVRDSLDEKAIDKLRHGANAVICLESPDSLHGVDAGIEVKDRSVDGRWGGWCNCLTWFKDSPAFAGAPVPRTLDFTFENLIPKSVITGIDPDHWERDVLGGMFVGWVNSNAAVVAQFRCGEGKAIITTLPLLSQSKSDPMAAWLLASLARYVSSDACKPAF